MPDAVRSLPHDAMSNLEFLERYARAGRVGLAGADTPIDRAIRRAQKPLVPGKRPSLWSHVFLCEGRRVDGHVWVIESDLDARAGSLRAGIQENRVEKYQHPEMHPNLAILDFGLDEAKAQPLVSAALDLLAKGTRYAVGGIFKTYAALLRQQYWKERKTSSSTC